MARLSRRRLALVAACTVLAACTGDAPTTPDLLPATGIKLYLSPERESEFSIVLQDATQRLVPAVGEFTDVTGLQSALTQIQSALQARDATALRGALSDAESKITAMEENSSSEVQALLPAIESLRLALDEVATALPHGTI